MDYELQLKVQAYLDGELPPAQAGEVDRLAANDPQVAALLDELRNTGSALRVFAAETPLPESREFFWSKIQRDIRRLEAVPAAPVDLPLLARLRRLLVPAAALAMLFIVGFVISRPGTPAGRPTAAALETALADSGAFTYRDYSGGTTLVWVSYPADNEVAENDEIGTVD